MIRWHRTRSNKTKRLPGVYLELNTLGPWVLQAPPFKIRPNGRSLAKSGGQYRSRMRGRGIDFSEVRQYEPGDDVRTIDWRVTARTSKPHTKVYEEERERPIFIVVDQSPSLFFGSQYEFKSFYAARLAALMGYRGISQGDRLGALLFNHQQIQDMRPARGKKAWQRFCQCLTDYNRALNASIMSEAPLSWSKSLSHLLHIVRPGSLIILISDFYQPIDTEQGTLNQLRKHNDLIFVQVYDPLEQALPEHLGYYTDGQQKLSINGRHQRVKQGFEQAFIERKTALEQLCNKTATALISMSTQDNPYDIARYLDPKFA